MKEQLTSRNVVLQTLKESYLRDVVVVKEAVFQYNRRLGKVGEGLQFELEKEMDSVPGAVLSKRLLALFAPKEHSLLMRPCNFCGGPIELVNHIEARKVQSLEKELAETKGALAATQAELATQKQHAEAMMAGTRFLQTEKKETDYEAKGQVATFKAQNRALKEKTEFMATSVKEAGQRADQAERDMKQAQADLAGVVETIEDLETENEAMRDRCHVMEETVSEAREERDTAQHKAEEAATRADAAEQEVQALGATVSEQKRKLALLEEDREEVGRQLEKRTKELFGSKYAEDRYKRKIRELSSLVEDLKGDFEAAAAARLEEGLRLKEEAELAVKEATHRRALQICMQSFRRAAAHHLQRAFGAWTAETVRSLKREHEAAVSVAGEKIASLGTRVEDLTARLQEMAAKKEGLEREVAKLEGVVDDRDGKISALEGKIFTLERRLASTQRDLEEVQMLADQRREQLLLHFGRSSATL